MTLKDLDIPVGALARRSRGGYTWMRLAVKLSTAMLDWMVVALTSYLISILYNRIASGEWWTVQSQAALALLIASTFVLLSAVRGQYQIGNYVGVQRGFGTTLSLWGASFLVLMAFAFATKTTDVFSRVAVILTFLTGFPAVLVARRAAGRMMTLGSKLGVIPARRVMLVGREEDVTAFAVRHQPRNAGMHIAGTGLLSPGGGPVGRDDIARIAAQAREMQLDDVLIIVPWSDTETIDRLVDGFMRIPVTIHLGPELHL